MPLKPAAPKPAAPAAAAAAKQPRGGARKGAGAKPKDAPGTDDEAGKKRKQLSLGDLLGERFAKKVQTGTDAADAVDAVEIAWDYVRHDGGDQETKVPQLQVPHGRVKYDMDSDALAILLQKGPEIYYVDEQNQLLRTIMTICELGAEWADPSKIPVEKIAEEWRSQSSRGRYESAMWRAAGLVEPNSTKHHSAVRDEDPEGTVDNTTAGGLFQWMGREPAGRPTVIPPHRPTPQSPAESTGGSLAESRADEIPSDSD